MYVEFIVIYAGMGMIAALQIAVLILVVLLMKRTGNMQMKSKRIVSSVSSQENQRAAVVFCTKCSAEFDSREGFCPKCGAAR